MRRNYDMPTESLEENTDKMRDGGKLAAVNAAARKARELHHQGLNTDEILHRMDQMADDEYLAGPLPTKGRKRAPRVTLNRRG